jgi:hypothetical protein
VSLLVRQNALRVLVIAAWLGLAVVMLAPPDRVPLETKESLFARLFFWCPGLVACSIGCAKRLWVPLADALIAKEREGWQAGLVLCALAISVDIVLNVFCLGFVMGRTSLSLLFWPVFPTILVGPLSLSETRRLSPRSSGPSELFQ